MPKIIVISGTATGMGRAAVGKLAAEGNPLRTSSAAAGAIAIVRSPSSAWSGNGTGALTAQGAMPGAFARTSHRTGTLQVKEGRSRDP